MGKAEFLNKYEGERQKCEVWSRVMGYYRNFNSFNVGKKSEFAEREFFKVKGACGCSCGC